MDNYTIQLSLSVFQSFGKQFFLNVILKISKIKNLLIPMTLISILYMNLYTYIP